MDQSVQGFYTKNEGSGYAEQYNLDHGPRLDAMITRFDLNKILKGKKVLDVGGGLGFLGKRLDPSNDYWVIDGAKVPEEKKLCKGTWQDADLDYTFFSDGYHTMEPPYAASTNTLIRHKYPVFDVAFCLETLEHLSNPYHCLAQMKKLVKEGGDIYISIPHANVWHNFVYASLMIDPNNFAQFLGQMALPVAEYHLWDKGWNAHTFRCPNRPYSEKVMLYPKAEAKFTHATPIEMVNW